MRSLLLRVLCTGALSIVLTVLLLQRAAAQPADALRLEHLRADRVEPFASVNGESLLVRGPELTQAVADPSAAQWQVRGDIREHIDLLHWSPDYSLQRDARVDEVRYRALVHVQHRITIAPAVGALRDPLLKAWARTLEVVEDPFAAVWPGDPDQPGMIVALWLVDSQVKQVRAQPIPQVGKSREFGVDFEFSLSADQARGQPALVLWQNGRWIAPRAYSSHAATQDAFKAVVLNDPSALRSAIKRGARLDEAPSAAKTTLARQAAQAGADEVLGVILERRDPLADDMVDRGATAVALAAARGRTTTLALLLTRVRRTPASRQFLTDALQAAAAGGHADCAALLLSKLEQEHRGADDFAPRAAMAAWTAGYPELCSRLIESASSVPSAPAPWVFEKVEDLQDLLLSHVRRGHVPMARFLFGRASLSPDFTRAGGVPLVTAVRAGDESMVRCLLAAGADPKRAAAGGQTPLIAAVQAESPALVALLLSAGAKPNAVNDHGMSALHFAAERNDAASVTMLLEAGADLQLCSIRDITPLDLALFTGSTHAVQVLMQHGACIGLGAPYSRDLLLAAISRDVDAPVATAVEQGWPAVSTFSGTWPALRVAELLGAARCAEVLRANGATSDAARPVPVVDAAGLDAPLRPLAILEPVDPRAPDEEFPPCVIPVRVLVDPSGRPLFPVAPNERYPLLVLAAQATAQQTLHEPPRRQGKAVAAFTTLEIRFPGSRDRVFAVEQVDSAPFLRRRALPYHPRSVKADRNARVELEYVVNRFGRAEQVRVVESSGASYTDSALLALSCWVFSPGLYRETPVAVRQTHTFLFDPKAR